MAMITYVESDSSSHEGMRIDEIRSDEMRSDGMEGGDEMKDK